jgi:hypothetical protein
MDARRILASCGCAASRFAGPAFGWAVGFGLVLAARQGAEASLAAALRD